LYAFEARFGGIRLTPLYPKANSNAIRILIRATKGSRAPLSIEQGIVLHNADGSQTETATAILRGAARLI
jgi:tRNA1(Val) A37 N6-methylase TrmN6